MDPQFWRHVIVRTAEECWPWAGSVYKTGYGQARYHGKPTSAHRVAYREAIGPIPANAAVRHTENCRNQLCCNPAHLYLTTAGDGRAPVPLSKDYRHWLALHPNAPDRSPAAYAAWDAERDAERNAAMALRKRRRS